MAGCAGPSFAFISNMLVTGNHIGLQSDPGGNIYSWGNNRILGNFYGEGSPTLTVSQH